MIMKSVLFLLFLYFDLAHLIVHNYYLGKFELRSKMDILLMRSKRRDSRYEQETAMTLTYPERLGPYGGKIEAVHVIVSQSMAEGRLFITRGQIGSTSIEIVVEADRSTYLMCNYTVYGVRPFERTKRVKFHKAEKKRPKQEL